MHIPKCESSELELIRFDEALHQALLPAEDYNVEQWLYVPNHYREYRYILGTKGSKPLICIGINPSTAAPGALDNTLKSVERIAKGNGYDSFIMFNVYAQRATDPNTMDRMCNIHLHQQNMEAFRYVLSLNPSPGIWAAWGTIIEKREYLAACLNDMLSIGLEADAQWFCAGPCSKKGHPHHPLYLKKDEMLKPFDLQGYLNVLRGE